MALFNEIEQAAGSGDEDIDAAAHGGDLGVLADAAVDHGLAEADVLAVGGEALGDLHRELAGRGEDEGAGALRFRRARVLVESVEDRQREAGSLAGAGLGATEEVAAF